MSSKYNEKCQQIYGKCHWWQTPHHHCVCDGTMGIHEDAFYEEGYRIYLKDAALDICIFALLYIHSMID